MRFFFLFLACLSFFLSAEASAKAKTKQAAKPAEDQVVDTGGLVATPVQVGGGFGFCVVEYTYADQRKLTVAMSPLHQINLGVTIPDAGFQKDAAYDLTYGFDGSAGQKIRGKALNENTVLLSLEVNPPFAEAMAKREVLEVGGGGSLMKFSLSALHKVIPALNVCVAKHQGQKQKTSLPPSLAALLHAAGMKDLKILSLGDLPEEKKPADYMWGYGHLIGGELEVNAPSDKKMADLVAMYAEGLKKRCGGVFEQNFEKEKVLPEVTIKSGLVSCKMKDQKGEQKIVQSLLFVYSSTHHLIIFTHEADEAYQAEAMEAREALARVVERTSMGQKLPIH